MSSENGGAQVMESPQEQLQRRMADPATVQSLTKLLDHLDSMVFAVEAVDGFLRRSEIVTESIAESVEELRGASPPSASLSELVEGVPDMLQTGKQLAEAAGSVKIDRLVESGLLERMTDPATLKLLSQLLDHLPLAVFALEAVDGFLKRGDVLADSMADGVAELRKGSPNVDPEALKAAVESLPKLAEAGQRLVSSGLLEEGLPKVIAAGLQMIQAGMLDPEIVVTLGQLGKTGVESYKEATARPVEPVGGIFALWRAMKDPEVQKAMGLFMAVAKAFARKMPTS